MKKASGQWLESAEMDLGSIDQIINREGNLRTAYSVRDRNTYDVPQIPARRGDITFTKRSSKEQ